jgi:hypothetical protein
VRAMCVSTTNNTDPKVARLKAALNNNNISEYTLASACEEGVRVMMQQLHWDYDWDMQPSLIRCFQIPVQGDSINQYTEWGPMGNFALSVLTTQYGPNPLDWAAEFPGEDLQPRTPQDAMEFQDRQPKEYDQFQKPKPRRKKKKPKRPARRARPMSPPMSPRRERRGRMPRLNLPAAGRGRGQPAISSGLRLRLGRGRGRGRGRGQPARLGTAWAAASRAAQAAPQPAPAGRGRGPPPPSPFGPAQPAPAGRGQPPPQPDILADVTADQLAFLDG